MLLIHSLHSASLGLGDWLMRNFLRFYIMTMLTYAIDVFFLLLLIGFRLRLVVFISTFANADMLFNFL